MEMLRNIGRRKVRSALTISGIVIGVIALTTMGALAENFNALLDGGVKFYSSNIVVGPPDGESASLLPISKIDEIKQIQGVGAAFPGYQFLAKPGGVSVVNLSLPDEIIATDAAENTWAQFKLTTAQGHYLTGTAGGGGPGGSIPPEVKKKAGGTRAPPARPTSAPATPAPPTTPS